MNQPLVTAKVTPRGHILIIFNRGTPINTGISVLDVAKGTDGCSADWLIKDAVVKAGVLYLLLPVDKEGETIPVSLEVSQLFIKASI